MSDHFTTLRSKGLNGSNKYWKEYVGSKTNEQISTLVLQENKARQISPKINIYCFLVCNTSFETYPFALLPTNDNSNDNENFH